MHGNAVIKDCRNSKQLPLNRSTLQSSQCNSLRRLSYLWDAIHAKWLLPTISRAATVCILGTLTACSGQGVFAQCPEGETLNNAALIKIAVTKLIRETQASSQPMEIQYKSLAHFFRENPNCCHVETPSNDSGSFDLPLKDPTRLAIVYRRSTTGEKPYYLRHITMAPCPHDAEESGHAMTEQEFQSSKKWKWSDK